MATMIIISEDSSAALVNPSPALDAARRAFIAGITPKAASFSIVIGQGSNPQTRFTI